MKLTKMIAIIVKAREIQFQHINCIAFIA